MKATSSAGLAYLPIGDGPPDLSSVDWASAPTSFKQYSLAPQVKFAHAEQEGLQALSSFFMETAGVTRQRFQVTETNVVPVNLGDSLTSERVKPNLLRSTPSGGALHPYELYMVAFRDSDLEDGLYHYNSLEHCLELLISGDVSMRLATAMTVPQLATKSVIVTCCFSRNAFKYQDFGYRVQSIDLGIVIGQATAAAARYHWQTQVRYQFDDDVLDSLLGLDAGYEATYAIIELGEARVNASKLSSFTDSLSSDSRTPFSIDRWKFLSDLHTSARRAFFKTPKVQTPPTQNALGKWVQLPVVAHLSLPYESVWQRQSAMHAFAYQELTLEQLAILFQAANTYINDTIGACACTLYAVVNAVSGLSNGIYRLSPQSHCLEQICEADLRSALQNTFGGPSQNAFEVSVGFFVVGNFVAGIEASGDRWYRVLNMDAGVIVAGLYRAANGLKLACHANLNYKLHTANQMLALQQPWTTLIQVLIGGIAPNGCKLDLTLSAQTGATL